MTSHIRADSRAERSAESLHKSIDSVTTIPRPQNIFSPEALQRSA